MPPSVATPLSLLPKMLKIQEYFKNPAGAAVVTIIGVATLQYACSMLYSYACIPSGFFGAFWNILSLGSPFCYAVNTIQYKLSEHYVVIWTGAVMAVLGWFAGKIKST